MNKIPPFYVIISIILIGAASFWGAMYYPIQTLAIILVLRFVLNKML